MPFKCGNYLRKLVVEAVVFAKELSVSLTRVGLILRKSCYPMLCTADTLKDGTGIVRVEGLCTGAVTVLRAGVGLGKEVVHLTLRAHNGDLDSRTLKCKGKISCTRGRLVTVVDTDDDGIALTCKDVGDLGSTLGGNTAGTVDALHLLVYKINTLTHSASGFQK